MCVHMCVHTMIVAHVGAGQDAYVYVSVCATQRLERSASDVNLRIPVRLL